MAEQRQPFRFRLPWLAAAPQPSASNTRSPQSSQAPAAAPSQRPPFRPAGVAPPPAQPPTRTEPPAPSSPNKGPQSRSSSQPPSPSRAAPPSRVPPGSPARRQGSQTQPTLQAAPQPTSPSRAAAEPGKPKATATSRLMPPQSEAKLQPDAEPMSPPKKPPTATEISQTQKGTPKRDISPPLSKETQPKVHTAPQPEEIESLLRQKNQEDTKEPSAKELTETESRRHSIKEVYQTLPSETKKMLTNMNQDEPKNLGVISGAPVESRRQPASASRLEGRDQHPSEDVFDKKEILQTFNIGGRHRDAGTHGHGRVFGLPEKLAMARREESSSNKETKGDMPKTVHKQGPGGNKHPSHERPVSIITLTGENKGATMHLSSEPTRRERSIHIHRGYKSNPDESAETNTDGEGSSRGKKSADRNLHELATSMYVNNNAQGINNSLVFNSSVSENNPGVHLALSRHPVFGPIKPGKGRETTETRKSEVTATPAERVAYAPSIKRRCLRGLFLESSDPETDNPEKPRRHGCRVGCNQKSKDGKLDFQ